MSDENKKAGWFSRFRKGDGNDAQVESDQPQAVSLQESSPKEGLFERFKREVREQSEPSTSPSEPIAEPKQPPVEAELDEPVFVAESTLNDARLDPEIAKPSSSWFGFGGKDKANDPKTADADSALDGQQNSAIEPSEPTEQPKPKQGWMARLRSGLARSSDALTSSISGIFVSRKLDDETLEELEDALIMADMGVETASRMVQAIAKDRFGKEVTDQEIKGALADEIAKTLEPVAQMLPKRHELTPQVILVAGVNGVGKTTTIGKIAKQQMLSGRRVMMAACDTFRAAAVEQLEIWGERNGCPVMKAKMGADPAGLAFDAFERARGEGFDVLLIDTAGRLQNKKGLMDELAKIVRVIKKLDESAPHDTLLVLDATTGQNAHSQVSVFSDMIDVSGLVVTKLDGTAKGGVVVALADRFGLPVYAVGVGETIDDLKDFEARAFARGLLGLEMADVA